MRTELGHIDWGHGIATNSRGHLHAVDIYQGESSGNNRKSYTNQEDKDEEDEKQISLGCRNY